MNSRDYSLVSETNADELQYLHNRMNEHSPIEVRNLMPFDVHLMHTLPYRDEYYLITILPKFYDTDIYKDERGNVIMHNSTITAFYVLDGKLQQFIPKHIVKNHSRRLIIGASTYDLFGDTDYHNSYADIPTLRLKNMFYFPVNIYYTRKLGTKSVLVVKMASRNGASGASKSESWDIIFRNHGNGFMIGDKIGIGLCGDNKPFYELTLTDPLIKNLYIGMISSS